MHYILNYVRLLMKNWLCWLLRRCCSCQSACQASTRTQMQYTVPNKRLGMMVLTGNPALGTQRQEDLWGLLSSQYSPIGDVPVPMKEPISKPGR